MMLHQIDAARKNCCCQNLVCFVFPTSDFFFPRIFRSICLCREIKKCACGKRLIRFWKLMASVFAVVQHLVADSERERRCCTAHRTRDVIQTTHFIRTPSAVVSRNTRAIFEQVRFLHNMTFWLFLGPNPLFFVF